MPTKLVQTKNTRNLRRNIEGDKINKIKIGAERVLEVEFLICICLTWV